MPWAAAWWHLPCGPRRRRMLRTTCASARLVKASGLPRSNQISSVQPQHRGSAIAHQLVEGEAVDVGVVGATEHGRRGEWLQRAISLCARMRQ
jgi:hypothetical protein